MNFLDYVEINPTVLLTKGKQYPFIEMANVGENRREPIQINYKKFVSGTKFQDGDSVVARIEPCLQNGKMFFCHNVGVGFGSTEYLVFRPKDDKLDKVYLYYLLQTDYIRKKMIGSMTGATGRQRVNNDVFKAIEIEPPEITIQKKIGSMLSAYDDLIENNQKQMKLLEEAAQRLYSEWFVDLRFPGYKTTPVVDGVPEGWRSGKLLEIAEFKRGRTITKAQVAMGNIPVVAGGLRPAYYHNKANTAAPVITVSGSGANAGFTRMYYMDVFASDCSFVDRNTTPYVYFIYCFLKTEQARIDSLQKGSAQPHVYAKDINALSLFIPDKKYMDLFVEIATPIFTKIQKLEKQIKLAAEARNRLLPKLMSGEIEV